MIEAAAKLMASYLTTKEAVPATSVTVPRKMVSSTRWTKDQVKLAFHLYCQIPYGRIYGRNPEIIALAGMIGRTADAVAMKMLNIASLDPAITSTGRVGLGNASALDEEVWNEFHTNWEKLALECEVLRQSLLGNQQSTNTIEDEPDTFHFPDDFIGETRQVIAQQRIQQQFFRRAVLSSYQGRCCMSGLSGTRLLVASHIVPWNKDKANRLNPANGLCLSAIHDKAFDRGLITLSDDFKIIILAQLHQRDEIFVRDVLVSLEGQVINLPERFIPDQSFLARHREEVFI